jgi:DMSO reductase family type II enzyme chaperone
MTTTGTLPASAARDRDLALARSLLYQALSIGFRPPAPMTRDRLAAPEAAAALARAAAVIDAAQGTELEGRALHLARGREGADLAALADSHRRLFGHTARSRIPAYETEYGADTLFQKPQEMSDIAGFLRAFGLALDPGRHERIDHVSAELELLAFLARKEAHALETGDAEMRAATVKAERDFLRDHLGRFAPSFARRAQDADPDGFYGALADLCLEFVKAEGVRLGVPLGPEALRLRAPIDDAAPMACGAAGGCAPGPCGPADDPGDDVP